MYLKRLFPILLFFLILVYSCKKDKQNENQDPFAIALPTPPVKVKNTNGTWMVYELHITGPTLQKVDIFNNNNLQLSYTAFNSRNDMHLASIWLPFAENGWKEKNLIHKFQYQDADGNPKVYNFNLKTTQKYPDPKIIDFPLPHGVWLAEGAASSSSYHTRSLFPFPEPKFDNLQQGYVFGNNPQRYAIDFVKLVDGLPYKNDGSNLEDWYCYNLPVLAAQGGKVLFTETNIPDNKTPYKLDYPVDISNATGNVVYIQHEDGTIATYCHLVPNSLLVQVGDIVNTGQELGRLGNSGNSSLPHLHFHVLTNPMGKQLAKYSDGLFMESLPYTFTEFKKLGSLPPGHLDDETITPFVSSMNKVYNNVLPSESDVIEF